MECTDHAGQRVDRLRIERVLHRRDALLLERRHRLDDLVTELDGGDALIAALDAGRLALHVDLEPNAADAGGLDSQATGFSGNAGICLIAADYGVERPMATELLVNHDIQVNVALRFEPDGHHVLDSHDVAGDAAFHVA